MTDYPWPAHPAAELFPLMGEQELAELAEDIDAYRLSDPVWLWEDPERGLVLLDGRNRVVACQKVGERIRTEMYRGSDPIAFAMSQNVKRRQLSVGEVSLLALETKKLYEAEAQERANRARSEAAAQRERDEQGRLAPGDQSRADGRTTGERDNRAAERAAKAVGVSGRSVQCAQRLVDNAPDLVEKVKANEMSLTAADRELRERLAGEKPPRRHEAAI